MTRNGSMTALKGTGANKICYKSTVKLTWEAGWAVTVAVASRRQCSAATRQAGRSSGVKDGNGILSFVTALQPTLPHMSRV